jgi:hypothetical protein
MEQHDYGLFNLALEAEIASNNLTIELMREEAMSIIMNEEEQEKDSSSKKEAFKKKVVEFLKKLKEFWNKIASKFAQIINKIIASTGVAQKFIAKNKQALSSFGGSDTKVSVNVLISQPNRMKEELGYITKATALTNQYLSFRLASKEHAEQVLSELRKSAEDISKSLVAVNTAKEEVQLTSTLVKDGISFLTNDFKKGGEALKSLRKQTGDVINQSKKILDDAMKAEGANADERRAMGWIWGVSSRLITGKLMQVAGRFVSMLNTCYVDYLKVCHKAVSLNKSQDKANKKAKPTAGDGKERKDVSPDRTVSGFLN